MRHNTMPVHFLSEPPSPAQPRLEEMKEQQSLLEARLASLNSQLAIIDEAPAQAPDFYSLHRAIAAYLGACSSELKPKVLTSLTVCYT